MHGQHPKRKGPGGDCVGGMTSRRVRKRWTRYGPITGGDVVKSQFSR